MKIILQLVESLEVIIDPLNLVFWILATAIFAMNSYKKAELRLFTITFLLMIIATIFCYIELEIFEATFIAIASSMAAVAAIYLRIKT